MSEDRKIPRKLAFKRLFKVAAYSSLSAVVAYLLSNIEILQTIIGTKVPYLMVILPSLLMAVEKYLKEKGKENM